jgi:outer membrane receptor protein involved in Fe transport
MRSSYLYFAALVTLPAAAQAQTSVRSVEPAAVAELVVTAQKRAESLSDVPMSITALSGDQLQSRGINNVQDLTKVTPGLSFVDSGDGVPVYSLRGVGFFDQSIGARPTVSVYVDEAPLPFSAMTLGSAFDLERVEVLKGPQGTLYGLNATGGAINYITAKPKDQFAGGVLTEINSFGGIIGEGFVTGPLSSTVNARLALRSEQGGAWQKSYTTGDEIGDKGLVQARGLLEWRPSARTTISVNLNGWIDKTDPQAFQLVAIVPQVPSQVSQVPLQALYPIAPRDDRAADWSGPMNRDNSFYQGAVRADIDLGHEVTLTSVTSYSRLNVDMQSDADGTTLNILKFNDTGRASGFSQEVRLARSIGRFDWIVGAFYAKDATTENYGPSFEYTTAATALPTGRNQYLIGFSTQDFDTVAGFVSASYAVVPDVLKVSGGVRYTKADLDFTGCSVGGDPVTTTTFVAFYNLLRGTGQPQIPPVPVGQCLSVTAAGAPGILEDSLNQDNVSWRIGGEWTPADHVLVYANVSRGYKAGSAPALSSVSDFSARPVTQESVLAYEAGFKARLLPGVLDASGAAFDYEYTDKQLLGRIAVQPTAFGTAQGLINVPKSRVRGAELQVTAYPTRGLYITVAGTYLSSKVLSTFSNFSITGAVRDFTGNAFPYTPKFQLVVDSEYKWPVGDELRAYVGGIVSSRSKTTAGFGSEKTIEIDGSTLIDLRVGVEQADGAWRVGAFVRNLTDKYYWTNVIKQTDTLRRTPGLPRTWGVQLSRKF